MSEKVVYELPFPWLRGKSKVALIAQIHKYGITYGAGDYGLNHLGDTDCCCDPDQIKGFSNWIRNTRTNVIIFNENIQERRF